MNSGQSLSLIERLEAAYDKKLPAATRQLYVERLNTVPYATGLRRVLHIIDTNKYFPRIAELMEQTDTEGGQINTMVRDTLFDTPEGRFAAYRTLRLTELEEAEYWEYVISAAERARVDNLWRNEQRTAVK